MSTFPVRWLHEPIYKIGQPVYYTWTGNGFGRWGEDRVLRYSVVLFQEDITHRFPDAPKDQVWAILKGYTLNTLNIDNPSFPINGLGDWPESSLYLTKSAAKRAAVFKKVKVSEETWLKAIGREDRKNTDEEEDEMELPPGCCGQVGYIRDLLFECKQRGGMIVRDVRVFQTALDHHEHVTVQRHLGKIFKKLGVKWRT